MHYRIKEKLRNNQLRVVGDQWPIFLYVNYAYDAEDPWNGLLRSGILVSVCRFFCTIHSWFTNGLRTCRPTSIYSRLRVPSNSKSRRLRDRATLVSTACSVWQKLRSHMLQHRWALFHHLLTRVEMLFLQARFALTSAQVFSRTDLLTDSERFYDSILELLDDTDERDEVNQLLQWWNRCV